MFVFQELLARAAEGSLCVSARARMERVKERSGVVGGQLKTEGDSPCWTRYLRERDRERERGLVTHKGASGGALFLFFTDILYMCFSLSPPL